MKSFKGKIVVITGAGSGIGRATALEFARAGAHVHVVDINEGRAQLVADEVRQIGSDAWAHTVDCSKEAAIVALAQSVYETSGRVDVLHNNAGIGHGGLVHETSIADWKRVIDINLWGTIYGIHTFVPRMIDQGGGGHIINTSSGLGLVAVPGMAPYCATKFAVVGISESIAAELRPHNIGVTVVCPGLINTDIVNASPTSGVAAQRREETVKVYEKLGVSPDVVARDILAGVRKNKHLVTTPSRQVLPLWMFKRMSNTAYQMIARQVGARVLGAGQDTANRVSSEA